MPSIGVLTLEIRLPNSHSLKEKRHTIRGLRDRLRGKFNVAVAEIGYQDAWQRALVSAVTVSCDREFAGKTLDAVEREASEMLGESLAEAAVEWLA